MRDQEYLIHDENDGSKPVFRSSGSKSVFC